MPQKLSGKPFGYRNFKSNIQHALYTNNFLFVKIFSMLFSSTEFKDILPIMNRSNKVNNFTADVTLNNKFSYCVLHYCKPFVRSDNIVPALNYVHILSFLPSVAYKNTLVNKNKISTEF